MTALGSFSTDYSALTQGCGLLDRSEHGKLALTGADTKTFLHGQLTQDITGLEPGHGAYAALLTNKGKMLADVVVLDAGEELLLLTERAGLQELFNTIRRFCVGYDVALHKRTLESGLLSLIGPEADAVVRAAVPDEASGSATGTLSTVEHDHRAARIGAAGVRLIRTDRGIDVLPAAADAEAVAQALIDAGAAPVSAPAAECLRIESGRPRYGVDLDDSVIPQEAGLNERAVSFTKGCYVGQETVARLFYRGKPNRELRGLTSAALLSLGSELTYEGRVVGTVTSVADSPRFGPLALALVRREAPVGTRVSSGEGALAAEVAALPFGVG